MPVAAEPRASVRAAWWWPLAPARRWRRRGRSGPRRREGEGEGRSPEIFFLVEGQVLRELVEVHVGVDLAAVNGEGRDERRIALPGHGGSGHVPGGLALLKHAAVPPPVALADG